MAHKVTKPPTRKQRKRVAAIIGKRKHAKQSETLEAIRQQREIFGILANTFEPITEWAEPAFWRDLNKLGAAWKETRELDVLMAALQKLADRGKGDGDFEQDCADALGGLEPRK